MSKIILIEEFSWKDDKNSWNEYDGYRIICEDGKDVRMGIDNGQSCCEDWGYLTTEDNLEKFVGANLLKVETVDEALNVKICPDVYEGGIMFINVYTSKGMFQFVAYNSHNGYYSHESVLVENGIVTHSEYL